MNFDRNTIIGFVLMMVLLFGYIFFTNRQQTALQKEKKQVADSIAAAEAAKKKVADTVAQQKDSVQQEATTNQQQAGGFTGAAAEQITVVENELMKVGFTNKGGYPKYVQLKNFKKYDSTPVVLGGNGHSISYFVNTGNNQSAETRQLHFTASPVEKKGEEQVIRFTAADSTGKSIEHIFTIHCITDRQFYF